jgi:hypothetical protein
LSTGVVDEYEATGKKIDALARRFAETHDPEVRKQIEGPQPGNAGA